MDHDDNGNNDEEKDRKLNENRRSPGKPGGRFRIRVEVPYSFLFYDFEFCFYRVSLWISIWYKHDFFLSLETLFFIVGKVIPALFI